MTETASGAGARKTRGDGLRLQRKGLTVDRVYTTPGVHPYDEVTWERRDVVQTNWKTGETIFEQKGVEFPDFWSANASTIVTTKYFRGAARHRRARVEPQAAPRPRRAHLRQGRQGPRLLRHRRRRGGLRARADLDAAAPGLQLQLARSGSTSAPPHRSRSRRLLHPRRRRLDGLDPQLVQGGGVHLQGRLRRRPQPLPHPLLQGAAQQRRHGVRPGLLHARRRRVRGHHQVRRRHPARGEDGRPRRRPPRHRGVHRDQGARGEQDPGAARRRVRHGPRRPRHHQRAVPERQQLGPGQRRVHAGGRGRRASSACAPAPPARSSRRVDAKELFGKMAKAAWECADPGIQYDDTINDWHTTPGVGPHHREQPVLGVHAPRQLLVQPGLAQPAEVPHRRRHLRRRDRSSRPSSSSSPRWTSRSASRTSRREAIGETTRPFRQLGIGYANLGALLMAAGLGLRLRRRPRAGGVHHLGHDRDGVPAVGRARRRRRPVRRATPATPRRTAG